MENKTKWLLIGGGVLVVVVMAYLAFGGWGERNATILGNNGYSGGVKYVFDPDHLPTGETIDFPVKGGKKLKVSNFFVQPPTQNANGQLVVVLKEANGWRMEYVFDGHYFFINLPLPSEKARQEAEQFLVWALEIREDDACLLPVYIRIGGPKGHTFPPDLPLSFCPGGLPLE